MPSKLLRALRPVAVVIVLAVAPFGSGCSFLSSPSAIGLDYMADGKYQEAFDILSRCAERGDPYCINNLGVMYSDGHMQGGPNYDIAAQYFTLAARYGLPIAQQNLTKIGRPIPYPDLQAGYEAQQAAERQMMVQSLSNLASSLAPSNVGTPSSPMSATGSTSATGCQGNWQCAQGAECVRASGTFGDGTCVFPIDQFGTRTHELVQPSVKPREIAGCSFDTDCVVGFTCRKQPNQLYGVCVR